MILKLVCLSVCLCVSITAFSQTAVTTSDRSTWLNIANLYCLTIWAAQMVCLVLYWKQNKHQVRKKSLSIRTYCRRHPVLGPVVRGCVMAIPLGIISYSALTLLSVIAYFPILLLIVAMPIGLFAERWFRKPIWLEAGAGISATFIMASLIFAVLANAGVLKWCDMVYLTKPSLGSFSPIMTHPWDSLKIWGLPALFMAETIVTGIVFQIIHAIAVMRRKESAFKTFGVMTRVARAVSLPIAQKRAKYRS